MVQPESLGLIRNKALLEFPPECSSSFLVPFEGTSAGFTGRGMEHLVIGSNAFGAAFQFEFPQEEPPALVLDKYHFLSFTGSCFAQKKDVVF